MAKRFYAIALCVALAALVLALRPVTAQTSSSSSSSSSGVSATAGDYAPVMVGGRQVFEVTGSGDLSAAERADKINHRLQTLISRNEAVRSFTAKDVEEHDDNTLITLGGEPILTVTDYDAQDALMTRPQLALMWGAKLDQAVRDARAARANPLKGVTMLIRDSFADMLVSAVQWLPRLVGALVVLALFWILARFSRWVSQGFTKRAAMDSNLRQLILALTYYGTWGVGFLALMSTLGLQSGSIATTLGVSGFVLGFAFKDILSHFFAGLMLLIGRQFHIGDQIIVNNYEGTVERIELRALYLRTYDNRMVIIPNGDVFTSVVTSNTASPLRRREFVLSLNYSDDIEKARRLALDTIRHVHGVAEDPAPDALVDELTASAVNLRIRFHTNSQRSDYLKVGSECMERIKEAFSREGILLGSSGQSVQEIVIDNLKDLAAFTAPQSAASPRLDGDAPREPNGKRS